MCKISKETVYLSIDNLYNYNDKTSNVILDKETLIDKYEDSLGTYLVQISSRALSDPDSRKISKMLHTIGDLERLSDHAVGVLKVAQELKEKGIIFSNEATKEIEIIALATKEILDITEKAYLENDIDLAKRVEPLEQVIDTLIANTKSNHIVRLRAGTCTIELGFVLSDLLNNFARISDHCSNIAVAIIETSHSSFGTHEYLNMVKSSKNEYFEAEYKAFEDKYSISASKG